MSELRSETKSIKEVNVRAVAIRRGASYLMLFNEKWGGFTFPMTKTRAKFHASPPGETKLGPPDETPEETAIRAAVEALGRPLRPGERPTRHPTQATMDCTIVSGRTNEFQLYHIELLELTLGEDESPRPLGSVPTAWMTLDEIESLVPVTVTAVYMAQQIREAGGR